jgi:WD40 repeat protein
MVGLSWSRATKLCLFVGLSIATAPLFGQMKLREELVSRQAEGGLALSSFGHGSIHTADFTRRDKWIEEKKLPAPADHTQDGLLSPDGNLVALFLRNHGKLKYSLGIIHRDGSGMVEYPDLTSALCWSSDSKRLIVQKEWSSAETSQPMLLDLDSTRIEEISVPRRATFTTQCWSPDGQQLVYHVLDHEPPRWTPKRSKIKEPPNPGTIFIYDIGRKKARSLGQGQDATWSPDGQWIAYWNDAAEWRMSPSGEERRRLFKRKEAQSPLLWSPDSRLVLYFRCCYLLQSLGCMCDVGGWFVRRLADDAEIRVGLESAFGYENVWIKSRP